MESNDGAVPPPDIDGGHHQAVFIRNQDYAGAMSWGERLRRRLTRNVGALEEHKGGGGGAPGHQVQYHLKSMKQQQKQGIFDRVMSCCGLCGRSSGGAGLLVGMNPHQKLAVYLHWMFRVNFILLFAVMCIIFFALVIFFAGIIMAVAQIDKECARVGSNDFDAVDAAFAEAFSFSWTTFSTVGYGSTYPAVDHPTSHPSICFPINFLCSLEALVGVLYSGFCGAILFGKVLRIQSHAQVLFSNPIVIRYGSGNLQIQGADDKDGDENEEANAKIPCPVLEIRVVNRLYNVVNGEIMDATLNCVANLDSDDLDPNHPLDSTKELSYVHSHSDTGSEASGSAMGTTDHRSSDSSVLHSLDPFRKFHFQRTQRTVDEDPSSRLVTHQIFSKLQIEASDHPFFKRVWLARHTLDEHSPILKPGIRRQIKRNGGFWPAHRNNYGAIRDNLNFNQILVSLHGVSNVSSSDVYARKIYDFVDVNIGYQFVNLLYREPDGSLGVDIDLINDVREQRGGGGEPLTLD